MTDDLGADGTDAAAAPTAPGRTGSLLAAAGLGAAALTMATAGPARAAGSPDLAALAAAAGIEVVAVQTYTAASSLAFVAGGDPTVAAFAGQAAKDHEQALARLRLVAGYLQGTVGATPNPTYAAARAAAAPGLTGYRPLVEFALTVEGAAQATYTSLVGSGKLADKRTRGLLVGLAAHAGQHLAVLRTVKALLAGGAPRLTALSPSHGVVATLPASAGAVGFPDGFASTDQAAAVAW